MRVDLFDFDLPESAIALRPAVPREAARLLHLPAHGPMADRRVGDVPALLRPGDALVFNDTRVIRARLHGVRERGAARARVEVLLHARLGPDRWCAFARPAKKLRPGDRVAFDRGGPDRACDGGRFDATVAAVREGGEVELAFTLSGPLLDDVVERSGSIPLPPYIEGRRPADAQDVADYQTIHATEPGAVAAPTAGLHFTPDLMRAFEQAGIASCFLTLHVGAGTFLPVKADDTAEHRMHAEWGRVDAHTAATLNACRARGGRVVAVGTTSLRLLESAATSDGTLRSFEGWTDIFITPGHRFRTVDVLVTNFHLPRSTLFMLVSAFAGTDRMKAAYAHAIAAGYRFYSYGDACFLERRDDHDGD